MTQGEPARPGAVRRSWSFVLLVFGGIFTIWGVFAYANTGSPLLFVGLALVALGLVLRFAR